MSRIAALFSWFGGGEGLVLALAYPFHGCTCNPPEKFCKSNFVHTCTACIALYMLCMHARSSIKGSRAISCERVSQVGARRVESQLFPLPSRFAPVVCTTRVRLFTAPPLASKSYSAKPEHTDREVRNHYPPCAVGGKDMSTAIIAEFAFLQPTTCTAHLLARALRSNALASPSGCGPRKGLKAAHAETPDSDIRDLPVETSRATGSACAASEAATKQYHPTLSLAWFADQFNG